MAAATVKVIRTPVEEVVRYEERPEYTLVLDRNEAGAILFYATRDLKYTPDLNVSPTSFNASIGRVIEALREAGARAY